MYKWVQTNKAEKGLRAESQNAPRPFFQNTNAENKVTCLAPKFCAIPD